MQTVCYWHRLGKNSFFALSEYYPRSRSSSCNPSTNTSTTLTGLYYLSKPQFIALMLVCLTLRFSTYPLLAPDAGVVFLGSSEPNCGQFQEVFVNAVTLSKEHARYCHLACLCRASRHSHVHLSGNIFYRPRRRSILDGNF